MEKISTNKLSNEEYESLIAKNFDGKLVKEKTIVTGKVVSIENDLVTIDVGSKSEGRIPVSEFHRPGQKKLIIYQNLILLLIAVPRQQLKFQKKNLIK